MRASTHHFIMRVNHVRASTHPTTFIMREDGQVFAKKTAFLTNYEEISVYSLADWAKERGTLGLDYADDVGLAALQAALAGALIHAMLVLKIARLVVGGAVRAIA